MKVRELNTCHRKKTSRGKKSKGYEKGTEEGRGGDEDVWEEGEERDQKTREDQEGDNWEYIGFQYE